MPTSAIGLSNNFHLAAIHSMRSQGFTLIELLIVLVLISVMTGMAMLAIGNDGKDRQQLSEARRLSSLLTLAEQEVVLRGEVMALEVFEHSYRFLIMNESGWQTDTPDALFRARELAIGTKISLMVNQAPQALKIKPAAVNPPVPHILLTPDGISDAIELIISDSRHAMHISNSVEQGWQVADVELAP
jgi:general secretion pathway protein H